MSSRRAGELTPRVRVLAVAVVAMAMATVPAHGTNGPLRSGRIVSGVLTTSPSWSCQFVPDCATWLASDCSPALAGRDPGWLASIVPVHGLADGSTRRPFGYGPAEPVGLVPGGVTIEFWRADCSPIGVVRRIWPPGGGWTWGTASIVVPRAAAWMTVTANDKVNLAWRLG